MPIPTDTFWNIRRLNIVFAISAILLFVTTAWSILQDYGKDWHTPQQRGRVWEAALVEEKIERDLTPDKLKQQAQLQQQIDEKQKQIEARDADFAKIDNQIKQLESTRSTTEFRLNTQKSELSVLEANLQDAKAQGDTKLVAE